MALLQDDGTGEIVVMYGPRGVGKTALLAWLDSACEGRMTVVNATPDRAGDVSADCFEALLLPRLKPDNAP